VGNLAKCSPDKAWRALQYLVDRGILVRGPEGGRSTSYSLAPGYAIPTGDMQRLPATPIVSYGHDSTRF
jgi:hypothetical protein